MKIEVKKSQLYGSIRCPPSKSYSHRAIVLAGLSEGTSRIDNVLLSRDTLATIKCVRMLGVEIIQSRIEKKDSNDKNITQNIEQDFSGVNNDDFLDVPVNNYNSSELVISSTGGEKGFQTPEDILNAENSGTTVRLLTTMCSLVTSGYSILTGDKSLRKRPMRDLTKALNQIGVECFSSNLKNTPPIIVKGGGIYGGITEISGKISSQFISSLLLSGIYAKNPITIKVLGEQVSKPYIESTISLMKKFGVEVTNQKLNSNYNSLYGLDSSSKESILDNSFTEIYDVPSQKLYNPSNFKIPGDFSTAALLMSSAFLSEGELTIENMDFSLPQGDSEIINIIRTMGGDLTVDEVKGMVKINGNSFLEGGEFDLKDTPDLLPVVSILALKSKKSTKITGISHARFKETDRVSNIASQIKNFGADVHEEFDSLIIYPPSELKVKGQIESFDDHRLFMAFTIASLAIGNTIIDGAESVDVSYPNFIGDLIKLGASIKYL